MSIPDLPTGQWWLTMTAEEYWQRVEARRAAMTAASPAEPEWQPSTVQVGPPLFPRIEKPKPVVINVPPASIGAKGT